MSQPKEFILGQSDELISLHTREENRLTSIAMLDQASLSVDIFSWNLDKQIMDNEAFIESVKQLALINPRSLIRILVQNSAPAVKNGHRLIYLGHRLPSKIQFRKPNDEYKNLNKSYMVIDKIGIISRNSPHRYDAKANYNAPQRAKHLLSQFNEIWLNSTPDPYLKRLTI
jgi:hypothetical protein